jgi:hypothetical protein
MPWVSELDPEALETPESARQPQYLQTPSSLGEAFVARAQTAISQGIGALSRVGEEGQFEGASTFSKALWDVGTQDEYGNPIDPSLPEAGSVNTASLTPEQQKAYLPPGETLGDKPLPEGIVKIAAREKWAQAQRDQIINRDPSILPVRFASGIAASFADPLNDATLFLPGIGEEKLLANVGKAGFAARTGARVLASGATGAVAQVPLSIYRGILSAQDLNDYSLRDAFQDMAASAAMNALVHAGFTGPLGDYMLGAFEPTVTPQTTHDALQTGLGQQVDGAPINVSPTLQAAELDPAAHARMVAESNAQYAAVRQATLARDRLTGVEPAEITAFPSGDEVRLVAEEAALKKQHADLEELVGNTTVSPNAEEATLKLARLEEVDRQLAVPDLPRDQAKELSERRDEILTDTNPETLRETAAPAEIVRQARAQQANITARLGDIAAQRQQAVVAAALSPLPKVATVADLYKQLADTARQLKEVGYAPGMPQADFAAEHARVYGPKEEGATPGAEGGGTAAAPEGAAKPAKAEGAEGAEPAHPVNPEIATAEAALQQGAPLAPEEAAELDQLRAGVEDAHARQDDYRQAYEEAGLCLKGD